MLSTTPHELTLLEELQRLGLLPRLLPIIDLGERLLALRFVYGLTPQTVSSDSVSSRTPTCTPI